MKTLHKILRILFGLTFIISGFTKLIDPLGTSLVVKEYFSFMHLTFLNPLATEFAITMSALEMLTGICVLCGIRLKIFTFIGMTMMVAFTLVTVYLVLYNPIKDCGCFGEVIHLTNWQSLGKNLVLLPVSIFLFAGSLKMADKASAAFDWIAAIIFAAFAAGISIDALRYNPRMDFTAYKIGTDMAEMTKGGNTTFKTTFIYEKDGVKQEFDIDSLPDESWTFLDSRTEMTRGDSSEAMADIALRDLEGNYRNDIFTTEGPMFAAIVRDCASMDKTGWDAISNLGGALALRDIPMYVFADNTDVPATVADNLLTADRKALITFLRSNGGVVYFNDGIITRKWAARGLNADTINAVVDEDPEEALAESELAGKRYAGIVFGILAVLICTFCLIRKAAFENN